MLEGLKVIELATYVAGPASGAILAEWGADVIKIETAGGDPMRYFFAALGKEEAVNPVFELDNRGKRAIVVDIRTPQGAEIVRDMVAGADVLLTNIRPASLKRAGLDWDSLKAAAPGLIYASVTGYGLDGEDADRAGFDIAAFWARSGLTASMTPKGGEPLQPRTAVGDHVCALATVSAILAAVIDRQKTGKGQLVETSLLRTGTYVLGTDLAIQLKLGRLASTRSRATAINPLSNYFQSADGRWLCTQARQNNADWPNYARAAGHPEWLEDVRFAKTRDRRENVAELVSLLDASFGALNYDALTARLDAEDVVWAPVQTPAEVCADPQAEAAGCFYETTVAGETLRTPATPARFHGAPFVAPASAPKVGQHTDAVLAEIGRSADQIATLREAGVVA